MGGFVPRGSGGFRWSPYPAGSGPAEFRPGSLTRARVRPKVPAYKELGKSAMVGRGGSAGRLGGAAGTSSAPPGGCRSARGNPHTTSSYRSRTGQDATGHGRHVGRRLRDGHAPSADHHEEGTGRPHRGQDGPDQGRGQGHHPVVPGRDHRRARSRQPLGVPGVRRVRDPGTGGAEGPEPADAREGRGSRPARGEVQGRPAHEGACDADLRGARGRVGGPSGPSGPSGPAGPPGPRTARTRRPGPGTRRAPESRGRSAPSPREGLPAPRAGEPADDRRLRAF